MNIIEVVGMALDKIEGWEIVPQTVTWKKAFQMLLDGKMMRRVDKTPLYKMDHDGFVCWTRSGAKGHLELQKHHMQDDWIEMNDET
jgi:hypothetical protein